MKSLKAAIGIGVRRASQRKQAGVATILVILMVGVGLVAVSVGTLHSMRNTQERQLVAHAQVNAQAGAWAAVEAVRQFLGTLTAEQIAGLATGNDSKWNISSAGTDGLTQTAIVKDIVPPSGVEKAYKITAEIGAVAAAGQSSSTIEVVYSVTPAGGDGSIVLTGVLDFYNDLKTTGGITLKAPENSGLDFNVDGNFTAQSASVGGTGFRNISVTGNISLDSQVAANVVRGRNITLVQSANVITAEAWGIPKGEEGSTGDETSGKGFTCCGNITLNTWGVDSSKPVVVTAHANGNVDSTAGFVTNILARKDVKVSGKGSSSINALGNVSVTSWTERLGNVLAGGNVTTSGGIGGTRATLAAVGKADCPKDVSADHTVKTKIAANLGANCKNGTADASIIAPVINKVEEVKLKAPVVDAWTLKAAANYAIEFTSDKKVKVTVKNVNGMTDGVYYLGHFGKPQTYLCKSVKVVDERSTCEVGTGHTLQKDALPFCINQSEDTECVTLDFNNKILSIKADSKPAAMPAGVIWFDGSLKLAGEPFFNTFIATQNILTHGDLKVYSVNYGSDYLIDGASDAICRNQRGASTFAAYNSRYPTNFCSSDFKFQPQAIGNIGLIAGSYVPSSSPKTYTGGNITLTAKTHIYGAVVAGNILDTSGSTTVYGYITAAGLMQTLKDSNDLTAELIVDLTKKPKDYTPDKIPDGSGGGGGAGATAKSEVLWSRYL